MKSKNSTKRMLLISVMAMLLCCTMLIGTTFAWFTDTASSTGNIIKAGTLDVSMKWLKGTDAPSDNAAWIDASEGAIFNNDKWEPGYVEARHVRIANEGSLAFKYELQIIATGTVSKLSDVIDVYYFDPAQQLTSRDAFNGLIPLGTLTEVLANFDSGESTAKGTLSVGENHTVTIALKMRESAGNEYQGLAIGSEFVVHLIATQHTKENDSFDNQYDAGATYPDFVPVASAQGLKEAMLVRGAKIVLADDIVVDANTPLQYGSYMFIANGREVTIDLNGHSIILDESASNKVLYMFTTANGGTLNIVGDGVLEAKNKASGICWAMNKNDQINIYGGDFKVNGENWGNAQACLYANSGNIDVYGGRFFRGGHWCSNVADTQGNRVCIVFHEGVLFIEDDIQQGDSARIKMEEGCIRVPVEIDGQTWYKIVKEEN